MKERERKQVINCQRENLATQAQRQASLEQAIKEAVAHLLDEDAETEVEPVHKLRRLNKLAADLQK